MAVRRGLPVTLSAWWPVVLGAPVTVCLAVVITARDVPLDGSAWSLLLIDFLTMFDCVMTGLAFAWALPVVIAVPSVTVLWFMWLGYGPSTDSELLHNLSSTFAACCDSATQPASIALRSTLALVGVIGLGICLLLLPIRWTRITRVVLAPAVLCIVGLGVGVGAGLAGSSAEPLTLQALEPRTTALVCGEHQGVRLCLWPENTDRSDELAAIITTLNENLSAWGLEQISNVSQADPDGLAVSVRSGDQLTNQDLRYSLASGYFDQQAGCVGAVGPARDERVALISIGAGISPTDLLGRFGPEPGEAAQRQLKQVASSPSSVKNWILDGTRALHCETP
jgi:hypothetical protein